ncbi:hypothetical protein GIY56_00205 [Paracoccus sp. YIM 132242]|uniref:Uncharacterized protein n=1 Tax=Paracoccus lichenicola TaxID=2665644 RepID=A0A6L6HHU5_9RHOB|nr:hypothetical protein [Paracoccus lichenicola]MTD98706.1 hypothetical protein [Paracoccus lichenicola]
MKQGLAATALAVLPAFATASSDDAWDAFRATVDTACRTALAALADSTVTVEVNPFGSESYGAALVSVARATGTDRMICILDKQTGRAEITAPFTDAAPVR